MLLGFLGGGTLGLCFAALTEVYLLPTAYGTFFGVGLIEESAKAIVLIAVARSVPVHDPREGMILGATVGAGFAAFESSGYALKAFLENADDHGVLNIVGTEAVRAVSAPFGHIMWTAILGGALFASWAGGRPHLTRRVGLTFIGIVVLHAMWDASNGWAITLTQGILGDGWTLDWPRTKDWVGFPTGQELEVYNAISFALLVIIAADRDAVAGPAAGGRTAARSAVELTAEALGDPAQEGDLALAQMRSALAGEAAEHVEAGVLEAQRHADVGADPDLPAWPAARPPRARCACPGRHAACDPRAAGGSRSPPGGRPCPRRCRAPRRSRRHGAPPRGRR